METTELKVSGMMCQACVGHVKTALQELQGVSEATVDLPAGRATVRHEAVNAQAMIEAVEEAGYEAQVA